MAYQELLRSHGLSEEALEAAEYTHVLNAQSSSHVEVESLGDKEKIKKVSHDREEGGGGGGGGEGGGKLRERRKERRGKGRRYIS